MEVWNTFVRQITALWNQWSLQQRVVISAAAAASLAAVIGTFIWATQPEYMVLVRASSTHEAAAIAAKLEAEQIEFDPGFSGLTFSVSRGDVAKARMALKDELDPLTMEESAATGMFPASPESENEARLHTLEKRISRTIEQMKAVRTATVHISRPDPSPFAIDQAPPQASVMVTPASGSSISNGVAQSIILTVARAVEGLSPENIALTDIHSRSYSVSDGITGDMAGQFEFQQRTELALAHKAESMLDLMLGEGRSVVRVTADIDFREISRTEKIVDPELNAKISETSDKVESQGSSGLPTGAAGAGGNLKPQPASDVTGSGKYTRDSKTIDYDTASTSETVVENPGQIKRLTVAAIVDLAADAGDESAENAAAAAVTSEQIEAIIQQAVGYDSERGDKIEVVIAALPQPVVEPVTPGFLPLYEEYKPLIEAAVVGLGATMAFFIAVLALRKLRPVIVQEDNASGFSREDYERMAELSQMARANPEIAARILSTWMGEGAPTESTETEAPRQSRAA